MTLLRGYTVLLNFHLLLLIYTPTELPTALPVVSKDSDCNILCSIIYSKYQFSNQTVIIIHSKLNIGDYAPAFWENLT
jgi:hypothetical protein